MKNTFNHCFITKFCVEQKSDLYLKPADSRGTNPMWALQFMNYSLSWNDYGSEFLLGICVTDQRLTVLQLKETLPITRNRDSVLLPSSGAHRWLSFNRICCYADKVGLFVLLEQIYISTQYFVSSQLLLLKSWFVTIWR